MRSVLVAVAAAALLAVPAATAELDPRALVLTEVDVPAGFRLDPKESGIRSNAGGAEATAAMRALFARSGRVTGYEAAFERRTAVIRSRADLFRRPGGAAMVFDWFEAQMRKGGIKGLRRARADIGAESWIYWSGPPLGLTLVGWRHDRVFAGVVGFGITKDRALALGRAQQRRITASLQ